MKTKSENLKLFQEASALRESVRKDLHNKANNINVNNNCSKPQEATNEHNKKIQRTV